MEKVDFVFVVLTYKNYSDLPFFLESVEKNYSNYKVVIVNSFFDEKSKEAFETIAKRNHCDFINIENKGYSYGNNIGISHCKKKYEFKFLIISNPDIVVKSNDFDYHNNQGKKIVIAPRIRNIKGKNQNPYWVLNNNFAEWLIYKGYKSRNRFLLYSGIAINKIIRQIFLIIARKKNVSYKVFAAHGSFVIFSESVLKSIYPLYDDNMFLFAEEALLAHKLKANKIPTIFTSSINVLHKEDGSVAISQINENDELRKSVLYYYKKIKHE